MWKAIGVEVELLNSETRVHYNALRALDFDVAQDGWGADYDDAQDFLFLFQSASGEMNYAKYSNPEYGGLVQKAGHTQDMGARAEVMRQAEQTLLDDGAIIPEYFDSDHRLVQTYVKGFVDNPMNVHRTRYLSVDRAAAAGGG